MAYGGKNNVTKQVVIYVKEHQYMSNQELNRNIRMLYGCNFADSTYDRIRNGEYDAKFNLINRSTGYGNHATNGSVRRNSGYSKNQGWNSMVYDEIDDEIAEETGYEECQIWNEKTQTWELDDNDIYGSRENSSKRTTSSGNPKKISGTNYLIAFCTGGLGIYGLFHGAIPFQNWGGFVIAVILIIIAIGSLLGK